MDSILSYSDSDDAGDSSSTNDSFSDIKNFFEPNDFDETSKPLKEAYRQQKQRYDAAKDAGECCMHSL